MDRTKKIQLLKDIKTGKKTIENAFPKQFMIIFFDTDERITDNEGKEYTIDEITELEKTKTLFKIQYVDGSKKEDDKNDGN